MTNTDMPFMDISKMMEQFKLPGVDMEKIMDAQRKDVEALMAANKHAYEGMQALAQRQAQILQETMTQWQNVMSLRIHLLARNVDQTAGYADPKVYVLGPVSYTPTQTGFRRHAYSEVVRLDNPAGRRE